MAERAENFIVTCLYDEEGFTREAGPALMELVELSQPDHWEFIRPGTLLAYYRANGRRKKGAADLLCSVESLQQKDVRYQRIRTGRAEGRMIADMDFWGKVQSSPLGSVVGKAIEAARHRSGAEQT